MRKKLLSILALLCLTVSSAWAGTQATGYFESCTAYHGSIRVKGWAYDPDQPATSIQVHAYIWYGPTVGTTQEERMPAVGINANIERSDVNEAKGITGAHGFDQYIAVPAGTYTVQVFAIDKTGDGNPKIPGTSGNPATYTVTVTDPYNITYDANGGSGAPDAQQKSEKININLSAAKPTRDGYVFKEWNTAQDGSGISYAPGAAYTADGDATLYAQWLKIDASGDCGTGVTYSLTEDGVMTISGSGAMAKYDPFMTKAPWDGNKASITSVVIESGVTSIGEYAFNQCANLASVTIPTGVTSIGKSAFSGCSSLTTITIPASVTTIGNGAFGSTGLTEVTIPASVTTLGTSVFTSCTSLTTVSISADLTSIGMSLFSGCSQLASVNIPASVTSIDGSAFYNCSNLTSISIPAGVTSIGTSAFRNCTGLTSIDLPANLTTIGVYAFYGCNNASLTSISIPASVTSIGQNAFKNCSNLATVTLNSNPTIGTDAFTGIADGVAVTMNLTANAAGGANWLTFYNQNYDFTADANTQVFKAALSEDKLTLTELITDQIVTKNNAVILKSTASPIVMTLTSTASGNDFSSNSLEGVSDAAGLTAANPSTTYVLNYKESTGVGFYKLASGKTLGVGKAYLTYSGSGAPSFLGFDETTGMNDVRCKTEDVRGEYYNLNGQRVAQPTKGLYIVNGKKVVIK